MKNENKFILKKMKELIPKYFSFLQDHGFKLSKNKIWDTWFYDAVYAKNDLYIRIDANTHFRDYPMYFNIILGEGDTEWPDKDWNAIALWRIAREIDKNTTLKEYPLVTDEKHLEKTIQKAKEDFLTYHAGFLDGNLGIFREARKNMNKNREAYKIHTPNKDGSYSVEIDKESLKLKKKYSE